MREFQSFYAANVRPALYDFEAFYRDNVQMIYALALSRVSNIAQAEDLTQDTFLRAWRHFQQLSALEPIAQRAWLIRTLRNMVIDVWRHQNSAPILLPETCTASSEAEEHAALRLDLAQALNTLEETDREIVMLRYVEEMNSREIGEMLEMPEGSVRRRLARCRKLLAQHLSGWGPEGESL